MGAPLPCCRLIIVSNQLPIRAKPTEDGWDFEWDEDALVAQAKVRGAGGCGQGCGLRGVQLIGGAMRCGCASTISPWRWQSIWLRPAEQVQVC